MMMPEYLLNQKVLAQISSQERFKTVKVFASAVYSITEAVIIGSFVLNFLLAGAL